MVTYEMILEARDNMHPEVIRTPLLVWRHGASVTHHEIRAKLETLQRTGSFKPRGAWNKLRLLRPPERKRGVICASAGNHAQGVALCAHLLGIPPVIVMPETAPEIKIFQTRLYGDPEIVLYGQNLWEAAQHAQEIREDRDLIYVHPYDDPAIIAGQGTMGLEILEQWPDVDTIVVPMGGGGLTAGLAVAILTHHPDIRIIGVQAKTADAAAQSLAAGQRIIIPDSRTVADGINVSEIGQIPFEILQRHHIPVLRVSDEEIRLAITALCQTAKLVVEPAGAAAAAAVLYHYSSEVFAKSQNILCILSGANITVANLADTVTSHPLVMSGQPPTRDDFA